MNADFVERNEWIIGAVGQEQALGFCEWREEFEQSLGFMNVSAHPCASGKKVRVTQRGFDGHQAPLREPKHDSAIMGISLPGEILQKQFECPITSFHTRSRVGRIVVLVAAGMVAVVTMSGEMADTFAASPIPTYIGASATTFNNANAGVVGLPGSLEANDVLLLVVETANQSVNVTEAGSAGTWTQIPDSPQGTGTAAGTTSTALTVFWARYPGTGTTGPTISDSGDHQIAAIHAFRGVATSDDPFDVTSGNIDATSDTSLSATGDTTTVANTLVVIAAALMDDAQNFGGTWTNADLSSITVRANEGTSAGNDGRLGVVTGKKTTAGAYGATTNTL